MTMTEITDQDQKAIATASPDLLAQWWCLLNKGGWPTNGLGEPEPMANEHQKIQRRIQIMDAICDRIGIKECLREWNRHSLPGESFDAWWNSQQGPKAVLFHLMLRLAREKSAFNNEQITCCPTKLGESPRIA
jgi:hypothetical protein